MKFAVVAAGLTVLASQASAHYIFEYLNGGAAYANIRKNTNYNSPVTDLTSDDLRCNVGATGSGTTTATLAAGSSVKFTTDVAVYHQGPVSFYISKAPSTASAADGSGSIWYKIKDIGPTFSGGTATWDLESNYSVTLPTCLADGDYLLRVQQLAIHNPWPAGIPQFYISCAQITVTGGSGGGLKGTAVAIPGAFKDTDPGYTVNIYNDFTSYTVPGPAVATC